MQWLTAPILICATLGLTCPLVGNGISIEKEITAHDCPNSFTINISKNPEFADLTIHTSHRIPESLEATVYELPMALYLLRKEGAAEFQKDTAETYLLTHPSSTLLLHLKSAYMWWMKNYRVSLYNRTAWTPELIQSFVNLMKDRILDQLRAYLRHAVSFNTMTSESDPPTIASLIWLFLWDEESNSSLHHKLTHLLSIPEPMLSQIKANLRAFQARSKSFPNLSQENLALYICALGINTPEANNVVAQSQSLADSSHPVMAMMRVLKNPADSDTQVRLFESLRSFDQPEDQILVNQIINTQVPEVFFENALQSDALTHQDILFLLKMLTSVKEKSKPHQKFLQSQLISDSEEIRALAAKIILDSPELLISELDATPIMRIHLTLTRDDAARLAKSLPIHHIPEFLNIHTNNSRILRAFITSVLDRVGLMKNGSIKRVRWNESDVAAIEKTMNLELGVDQSLESEVGAFLVSMGADISDGQLLNLVKWHKRSRSNNKEAFRTMLSQNVGIQRVFDLMQEPGRLVPNFVDVLEFIVHMPSLDPTQTALAMLNLVDLASPEQVLPIINIASRYMTDRQIWPLAVAKIEASELQGTELPYSIAGILHYTNDTHPYRSPKTKSLVLQGKESENPICALVTFKDKNAKNNPSTAKAIDAPQKNAQETEREFVLNTIHKESTLLPSLLERRLNLNTLDDQSVQVVLLLPAMTAPTEDLSSDQKQLRALVATQLSLAQLLHMMSVARQAVVRVAGDILIERINNGQDTRRIQDRQTLIHTITPILSIRQEKRANVRQIAFRVLRAVITKLDYQFDPLQHDKIIDGLQNYFADAKLTTQPQIAFLLRYIVHGDSRSADRLIALTRKLMHMSQADLLNYDAIKRWQVWTQSYHTELLSPYKGVLAYLLNDHQGFHWQEYRDEMEKSVIDLSRADKKHLANLLMAAFKKDATHRFNPTINIFKTQKYFSYVSEIFKGEAYLTDLLKKLKKFRDDNPKQHESDEPNDEINDLMDEIGIVRTMLYELQSGRLPIDVSGDDHFGYDVHSVDLRTGEIRNIEVKCKFKNNRFVKITKHQFRVAREKYAEGRSRYYLYIPNIHGGDGTTEYRMNGIEQIPDLQFDLIAPFVVEETYKDYKIDRTAFRGLTNSSK